MDATQGRRVDEASSRELASHFAFGRNWLAYAELIDEARITQATEDLRRLAGGGLEGKSFLDIGCGSGLHALAAIRLGASRVEGFDIDPDSVTVARATLARFAPDADAKFRVISVFDATPETLGTFDVVYSWGVLHHTGDMLEAIRTASRLVASDGTFLVALYRRTNFCGVWRVVKRWYSNASPGRQRGARAVYRVFQRIVMRLRGLSYRDFVAGYSRQRGMSYEHDVHDWLGGYPYESIRCSDCVSLMEAQGMQLDQGWITPVNARAGLLGSGCDEYRFVRRVVLPPGEPGSP